MCAKEFMKLKDCYIVSLIPHWCSFADALDMSIIANLPGLAETCEEVITNKIFQQSFALSSCVMSIVGIPPHFSLA